MELLLLMSLHCLLLFNVHITSADYYQALNAEISIEDGAAACFEALLKNFSGVEVKEDKVNISEIVITEVCRKNYTINCLCGEHFTRKNDAECIPNGRVSVNGTVVLTKLTFDNELTKKNSPQYKNLSTNLTEKFAEHYSKLKWFKSLSIQQFSKGSVKVDFIMTFDMPTNEGLDSIGNITDELEKNLNGQANLVTEGFVKISAPPGRVESYSSQNLSCATNQYIGPAAWYLLREMKNKTQVHNGTEVYLTHNNGNSTASLYKTSHIWRGEYTCEFQEGKVLHQAHTFLDVAVLPEINIYSIPQFPNCKKSGVTLEVFVTCAIENSMENYNVTWEDKDFTPARLYPEFENGDILYTILKTIECDGGTEDLNVTCTFENGLKQSKNQTLNIPVINSNSKVCEKNGDWPTAKAGYIAKLICNSNQRGERTRQCGGDEKWKEEISHCVNVDLDSISSEALNLQRGLGNFTEVTPKIFQDMKISTQKNMNSSANINTSVNILKTIHSVSANKSKTLEGTTLPDFLTSVSNIINDTLKGSWNPELAAEYLQSVNGLLEKTKMSDDDLQSIEEKKIKNVGLKNCSSKSCKLFNAKVDFLSNSQNTTVTGFLTLGELMPQEIGNSSDSLESRAVVLQVNGQIDQRFSLTFENINRTQNHFLHCVVWDPNNSKWSGDKCTWAGADDPGRCDCDISNNNVRSSGNRYTGGAFTVLMSKNPVLLPFMDELTMIGLIVSIVSLIACLVIEFLVWNYVVKSSIAHFRHTAVVNISLCLLLADSSFLSTAFPESTPSHWCRWLVVVKHYCFLAMFFWMLCLSLVLLHSLIFIFQRLRKKVYMGVSFSVGYVCPLIIVVLTVIAYDNGDEDSYYKGDTCWLKYEGFFKGSFYAFVMPVGIIVGINILSMLVVIAKLLAPSVSESRTQDDKEVIRSILKAVIFLTPVFGVTWIFGFFILVIDHTTKPLSGIVNYAFTVCNAFQGLFILLTACLGEKKVREALSGICSCKSKVYKTSGGERSTSKTSNGSSLKKK